MQGKLSVPADRLSIPVRDRGTWWIAKLPDRANPNVPANEYIVMTWLARAGFEVPVPELAPARVIEGLPEGMATPDDLVYLIPRFDRSPDGPVHIEDFAQVLEVEPRFKYDMPGVGPHTVEGLGSIIAALTGESAFMEYIRRLVAMILTGNNDAHLKNWSLIYRDGRTPELSPVYDFLSTTVYLRPYSPFALPWLGETIFERISLDHVSALAERVGIDDGAARDTAATTVDTLRRAWSETRVETDRFPAIRDHIDRRFRTLPLSTGKPVE
ncbi:HipA-like N-terminal domain-containing protein [Cryptosporangium aurantiacum]|uniref:HipA-like N-terminal domain-containing protein n=2 Tax=Cryptosporangium aurantiacum TaxID=134849 RepID=A0A1M7RDP1_9ACTN|nr:HipA-like N-terminal domain-containing protein [Cryptosporangium aurantiacum]